MGSISNSFRFGEICLKFRALGGVGYCVCRGHAQRCSGRPNLITLKLIRFSTSIMKVTLHAQTVRRVPPCCLSPSFYPPYPPLHLVSTSHFCVESSSTFPNMATFAMNQHIISCLAYSVSVESKGLYRNSMSKRNVLIEITYSINYYTKLILILE